MYSLYAYVYPLCLCVWLCDGKTFLFELRPLLIGKGISAILCLKLIGCISLRVFEKDKNENKNMYRNKNKVI